MVPNPVLLWCGFTLVHLVLVLLAMYGPGWPIGDLEVVYRSWADGAASGYIVGISTEFVYPILAAVPIFAALAFGGTLYVLTWFGIVTLLDAVAFAVLLGRRPGRAAGVAAWWWLGFLLLLGPVALARIDSVTVPLVIVAVLWLRTRPGWGVGMLVIATWVKVWPVAAILALLVVAKEAKERWRILAAAVGGSALIVVVALILGSGWNVFSFVTQQTSRGIQIESPVAGLWMWPAAFRAPGSFLYYDDQILTFQVTGPGVGVAINLMTPLMAAAAAAVLVLGAMVVRRGADWARLFPPLVLALVLVLIVFNKVGSPQFVTWIAAPVILGLVLHGRAWRTPAILAAVIAALTQLVYPYLYDWLLRALPIMVLVLTLRNVLEVVLLGWAIAHVWALARRSPATPGIRRAAERNKPDSPTSDSPTPLATDPLE